MRARRKFSAGRQSRHFACPFQAADDAMQMDIHITLYPVYTTKKGPPCYGNSPKNALRLQQCFFSHSVEVRD